VLTHWNTVGSEDDLQDLEARVNLMRRLGVTKWGDIELGAEPLQAEQRETQQLQEPEDIERKRRAQVRRIALGAAGALVPRLGEDR